MRRVLGPRRVTVLGSIAAFAAAALVTRDAGAQLRWDASVHGGAMERVLTSGAGSSGIGPIVGLKAHVALLPLVRIGAYATHDISPSSGEPSRQITSAGASARVSLPILSGPWHSWVFTGLGYSGVYAPSHTVSVLDPGTGAQAPAFLGGAGGGFMEVPLGIGAAYRFRRPWELSVELGGRAGFLRSGSAYDGRTVRVGPADVRVDPAGNDAWAISLTVGIGLDR